MGFLYLISLVFYVISFLLYKKSDNKLNIIKWIILSIGVVYAVNIVIGMLFGVLRIPTHLWLLSIVNFCKGLSIFIFGRKKGFQKYTCSKYDVAGILLLLVVFSVMFVKDLYIYKGGVTHVAVDSAIHYRAAKEYAINHELFVFSDSRTIFNFNIMQTGAYINDGILMDTLYRCFKVDYIYSYQIFETLTMFVNVLMLYAFFMDKINTKRGVIGTILLLALYLYGYPYNSWIYGFSYLSVGLVMVLLILHMVEMLYDDDKIARIVTMPLIAGGAIGLTFSYCLFVPPVFSSICIFVFIKELQNKDDKKFLKIFGKTTILLTIILLIITILGICYLVIPSFKIEGQTDIVSALKTDGGIYPEKYRNFLAYIPIALIFVVEEKERLKKKQIRFLDIFSIVSIFFLGLFYVGMILGKVSPYYLLKLYFMIWIVIFALTVDILNRDIDKKMFRLSPILLVYVFAALVLLRISAEDIFRIFLIIILGFYVVLPQIIKREPKEVGPLVYVIAIFILMAGWTSLKSDHILSEEHKHSLMNLAGMYYSENSEYRKAYDAIQNFSRENIEITKYARENLEDMTADNTILFTESFYRTAWAMATLEYESNEGKDFNKDIINKTNQFNIKDSLEDEDVKYIIRLDPANDDKKKEMNENIEGLLEHSNVEILFKNESGYVAKINR